MYVALYRKYRPKEFSQIIGQEHITTTLINAIKSKNTSHAYLFAGGRGTGKTSTAKILAKSLNCQTRVEQKETTSDNKTVNSFEPCNKCLSCMEINNNSSVDVIEIDAASNRGIDEIRNLREKVHFAPSIGSKKVFIIDEVHMLTTEAFNALLKMIEEPPDHAVFILATTEVHKVIPTIVSRCQRFDFRRILVPQLVGRLKEIAEAEKIEIDDASLAVIARQAQGSARDSIGLLDQLASFSDNKITSDAICEILNLTESELLFEITDLIAEKDTLKILKFIDNLMDKGLDLRQFTAELVQHFRSITIALSTDMPADIIHTTPEILSRIEDQASKFAVFEALKIIDSLSDAYRQMRYSSDVRLLLEITLIKITKLETDLSTEGLLYRIEELEKNIGKKPTAEKEEKNEQKNIKDKPISKKQSVKTTVAHQVPDIGQMNEKHGTEKNKANDNGSKSLEKEKMKRVWPLVVQKIKEKSIPLYSLLLECHAENIDDEKLVLNFNKSASFHMKEVSKGTNLALIKEAAKNILGRDIGIECMMNEEIVEKNEEKATESDKIPVHHAIKMMQDSFGAEIVEKTSINKED